MGLSLQVLIPWRDALKWAGIRPKDQKLAKSAAVLLFLTQLDFSRYSLHPLACIWPEISLFLGHG